MLDGGLASGTWYLTIVNIDPSLKAQSYKVSGEVMNVKIIQNSSSRKLGSVSTHHIVSHGRQDNQGSFQNLANLISKKDSSAGVFRIDWSDGAVANYPANTGLQGSRFIKPAGKAIASLLSKASVSRLNVRVWGHSWGSYVMQETSVSLGGAKSIVALDPAETTYLSGAVGNEYSGVNFSGSASNSLAIVSDRGWYGGESEANTATVSVCLDVRDKKGAARSGATFIWSAGSEDVSLHSMPVRCIEYSLGNYSTDAISKQLVASAFIETGALLNRVKGRDYDLVSSTDGGSYLKHTSIKGK
jgi:pimeloyl-ACP methyl ester carboxylesterase